MGSSFPKPKDRMDLKLVRGRTNLYGVFGQLLDSANNVIAVTLEHAYLENDEYVTKLSEGTYICTRYDSPRLGHEVFAIPRAPDFYGAKVSYIEFHMGNYNKDSQGCILLGSQFGAGCILDSKIAFEKFMALQTGCDFFQLEVV